MCLLHDKYDVGPLDEFCCNRDVCIMVRSGRRGFDVWIGGENLFGRGTSESILAAYEEQSHHDWRLTYQANRRAALTLAKLMARAGPSG